jgi:hypothetical protein
LRKRIQQENQKKKHQERNNKNRDRDNHNQKTKKLYPREEKRETKMKDPPSIGNIYRWRS